MAMVTGTDPKMDQETKETVLTFLSHCCRHHRPPGACVIELVDFLNSLRLHLPSPDLAHLLVSHLCFDNNHPWLWKFLHHALSSRLLFPLQLLSLLSSRVIPHRHSHPQAHALFLALLAQHVFTFDPVTVETPSTKLKIINSVDVALQLSETYKIRDMELGHVFVLFFYSIIIALIDSTLNDWGLQVSTSERSCLVPMGDQYMEIDHKATHSFEKGENHEQIRKKNSIVALEILESLTESKKAVVLLQSVLLNMPEKFNCLLQRFHFLKSLELNSAELISVSQVLKKVSANIRAVSPFDYGPSKNQIVGKFVDVGSQNMASLRFNYSYCQSPCWVPLDIYMENSMDSKQIPTKSAIIVLTESIKTLQKFNQASWQETFLAVWLSALRLVQRDRDPPEGPIPHLEARMSMLLSIVPLAIANVLNDDSEHGHSSVQVPLETGYGRERKSDGSRKLGLISSIQVLGHFSSLLCPPTLVVDASNQAARKAASFIYSSMNEKSESGTCIHANTNVKAGGNLRHLIVEACIARNLIDTSVYFWPGYVSTSARSLSDSSPLEKSPWLTFMEGTPLNSSLINSLTETPASSLAEIEKLYYIAINGSEVEKPAAAKILCGASLIHGWYIQEHVVHYVVKLLASSVPFTHSGSWSHSINNMSMLSAVLHGVSSVDTVHILSLHGVIPTVAASLLPLCEAFGSVKPTSNSTSNNEPSASPYMAFSLAFLFLIRLWKFSRPPLDQFATDGRGAIGGLEYLLSLHNNCIISSQEKLKSNTSDSTSVKPVYIDSFPKLRAWYCQQKSCVASSLSGLSTGNSIHQVANLILSMIYQRISKGVISSSNSSSSPTSSNARSEDAFQRPMVPAWEVLEVLPFVLEAILTACAHGRLSSRDLTTGLRDLVDFLPASLTAIMDYFTSEVTRGVWKPVPMNGTDWPSPAALLPSIESEIKTILTSVGVDVPSHSSDGSPVMLPLPMAVLVSLSITFKLDKNLEYMHSITGAALENCASGCPLPSMPIIGSLWAQKVRRWHNFIVVSCARSVFRHNKVSVAQLLRSCFSSFLGTLCISNSKLTAECRMNGLMGSTFSAHGSYPYVAPGFLFIRSCRNIHNVRYLTDVIVDLVTQYSNELASTRANTASRIKSSEPSPSLSLAMQSAKEVAMLGASLLCAAGGILLVQELYKETIPTWLLSRDVKHNNDSVVCHILEGYAMAYLLILSGSLIWGVGAKLPSWTFSRRNRTVGVHLDFLAEVMERKISLSCHPVTWKTYVSSLVGLMITYAPAWIREVKVETLRKLAHGLCRWHKHELALSLLQRGGVAAMGALAELVNLVEFEQRIPMPCS